MILPGTRRRAVKRADGRLASEPPKAERLAQEFEKPVDKRAVDLDDDQVYEVLLRWDKGLGALALPFVEVVWGGDGKARTR